MAPPSDDARERGREDASPRAILVAGAPRTGTTWVAQVLGRAEGAVLVSEPDNEWPDAFALKAKIGLGRFPVLRQGDPAPSAYLELWRRALAGFEGTRARPVLRRAMGMERIQRDLWRALCDHRSPRVAPWLRALAGSARPPSRRADGLPVVKSVHAPLAVAWIAARLGPRMVVVERHPLNVVASWLELGWGDCALSSNPGVRRRLEDPLGLPELPPDHSPLAGVAWEIGLFTSALRAAAQAHPEWSTVSHEALCRDPAAGFAGLYRQLGLGWTEDVERFLEESNRAGSGYSTVRVAAEQPERWRRRLTSEQIREAWSVLSGFRADWVEDLAADLG